MKRETKVVLDEAFGSQHTRNIMGAMADATAAGGRTAEVVQNAGLALAFDGMASAVSSATSVLDAPEAEREGDKEALIARAKAMHRAYMTVVERATPMDRAKAYSALESIKSVVDAALGVVQAVMITQREIAPLVAVKIMAERADDAAPSFAEADTTGTTTHDGAWIDPEKLDSAFAEAFDTPTTTQE